MRAPYDRNNMQIKHLFRRHIQTICRRDRHILDHQELPDNEQKPLLSAASGYPPGI